MIIKIPRRKPHLKQNKFIEYFHVFTKVSINNVLLVGDSDDDVNNAFKIIWFDKTSQYSSLIIATQFTFCSNCSLSGLQHHATLSNTSSVFLTLR